MGCDIHMVVERRWKREGQNDVWVGLHNLPSPHGVVYGEAHVRRWEGNTPIDETHKNASVKGHVMWEARQRNYSLFYALAQVRGHEGDEPGPEPRGVPDDVSDLAQMEIDNWGGDGHSHSFMLMSEALPILIKHQLGDEEIIEAMKHRIAGARLTESFQGAMVNLFGVYMDEEEELDDYRLCFWFDN